MIYVSSSNVNKEEIKRIYKKYHDLPPDIIKQIVDYKINKDKKFNISRAIGEVRDINEEISKTEDAIRIAIKGQELIKQFYAYTYEIPVMIDCGDGYSTRTTISLAMDRITYLKKWKREIMQNARYERAIKPFVKTK